MSNYLGIDIGGTNTCYGIVNEEGEFLYENTIKTREVEIPRTSAIFKVAIPLLTIEV